MKKVLDFSRVPLDKWIDLYNSDTHEFSKIIGDINKFAEVDVKEVSDHNREIVQYLGGLVMKTFPDELVALLKSRDQVLELKDRVFTETDMSGEKEKDQK